VSQKYATGYAPIADSGPGSSLGLLAFDVAQTIISQYANSPVLLALLRCLNTALDQAANIEQFYTLVWDLRTAVGYGLDVWGRIVGVKRVLRVPTTEGFLGWDEATDAKTFGYGVWAGRGTFTQNYYLADDAFRRLVFAKAALNITDGSIPAINRALMTLFPDHGNCYVRDDGGMAMTYVFGSALSPLELAIVSQSGVLPKPAGVSVSGEVAA
jgi:hypothetical protein